MKGIKNSNSRFIAVLRIGHRLVRDDRSTTHVCLVARAFGANKIFVFDCDPTIIQTIHKVNLSWGGNFVVDIVDDWRLVLKNWRLAGGLIIHLTMYGVNLCDSIQDIRSSKKDLLVVVGAEKVPKDVYQKSDYNIAIGSQPHSEVAALAVFLDQFFMGEELKSLFIDPKYRIVPNKRKKHVEIKNENRI